MSKMSAEKIAPLVLGIFVGVLLIVIVVLAFEIDYRNDARVQNINEAMAFGERHECVNVVLKKGECLSVNTEIGELIVCLPKDGKPEVRVSPDGTSD